MKRKIVLTGYICLTTIFGVYSQGINFKNGLTWKQVLEKAKKEKKLILADCYTTWCGPCKQMDREIHQQADVGDVINKNFLSIKIQMDSTPNDSREVRNWYAKASQIRVKHEVNAYPSYLIFSSDGHIVYRTVGAQKKEAFINIMQTAADSGNLYAQRLINWNKGKKDFNLTPWMILKAESTRDKKTATLLARDCIDRHIPTLSGNTIYNKELLLALAPYIEPKDKLLCSLFYPMEAGSLTDSLLGQKGVSKAIADIVIEKYTSSLLVKENDFTKPITQNPDWEEIRKNISENYNEEYADKNLNRAKQKWYRITSPNRNELAKVQLDGIKKYHSVLSKMERYYINNTIWYDIFIHVNDTTILKEASSIMKNTIEAEEKMEGKSSAGYTDTYANLLYKIGYRQEAIEWQQKAVNLRPEIPSFKETLEKMQKNEQTW